MTSGTACEPNRLPSVLFNQLTEFGEEGIGIVWAGGGFGMVLHAEDTLFLVPHALDGLVVEVDPIDLDVARERFRVDGKAMILRGDHDAATFKVFDRLIGAPMAELQFECFAPECLAEDLVSETDSEDGNVGFYKIGHGFDGVTESCRITGAVGA